jgi:HlyD family secretion protein
VGERIRGSDFSEDVVLLMGGLADMEVKVEVGEHDVIGIHDGDEATIDIDAMPDRPLKGHVVSVGKNAQIKNQGTDAEVTTFFVRVGLDDPPPGVPPGLSAAVSIATATHKDVLTVPIQAVTSREPKGKSDHDASDIEAASFPAAGAPEGGAKPKPIRVVFVVSKGNTAQMRAVRTGIATRTHVEILEGVVEGETVVDGPYRTLARELRDGQSVKEQPKSGTEEKNDGTPSGRT